MNMESQPPLPNADVQRTRTKKKSHKTLHVILFALLMFIVGTSVGFTGRDTLEKRMLQGDVQHENLPENLQYDEVETVYDSLRTNFDGELRYEDLINGLKEGLVKASGDPYTEFLDEEEAISFEEDLNGKFTGIGAELGKDGQFVVIVSPLSGFPAEAAGLMPRDVIAEIDGENAYDISISEAVSKIRGEKGTNVKLTIVRNETERLEFEITRDEITIPSVEYEIREGSIGYLKISRFGNDTTELARKAATEFINQNVTGVIVDVRGNPGGLLDAAVKVTSLWVEEGQVVVEQRQSGKTEATLRALGNAALGAVPTVVLIDEGSASASEILAGALRDHGKAKVIGEKSYGKGSVQKLIQFRDGSELKVTVARWFTPGGKNIDQEGIEPDEKVERTIEDFEAERDPQLDVALGRLKE